MLTVHHLNNSRSQRVLWLLEELGVEYDITYYERDPETMRAPKSLRKVHPLGKAPIITDDDFTLAETGAIIEYLLTRYDNSTLHPAADAPNYWQYRHWMHYVEGSAMPPLLIKLLHDTATEKAPALARPIAKGLLGKIDEAFTLPEVKLHLDYCEQHLNQHEWFAGDSFSAADVMMSFPLETSADRLGFDDYPKLKSFVQRIHARPAYQRALKRGGEYAYA